MFGYIKPLQPELKVRELEFYRGVYCGLCRSLGKNTGCLSRFALSYDLVYLGLVRMAVKREGYRFTRRRCLVHPIKRRNSLEDCEAISFCAYATAALTAEKLEDNRRDERGFRRFIAILLTPYRKMMKRRSHGFSGMESAASEGLAKLSELEKSNAQSLDAPAEAFAESLSAVCSLDAKSEADRRILADIGRHLGRFIYIADAADDIESDVKEGKYNPINAAWGVDSLTEEIGREIFDSLLLECKALELSLSLLDFSGLPDCEAILLNITRLGMPAAADKIINRAKQSPKANIKDER